eukprot:TRINITY_DN2863_c0_g2_i1.p1 TRINITY_DN2863_c0_g2~~TRINITY_DN2863_c0_g2_i1.p1  ORF type:complete len:226 (+),score=54.92 TRINITY_DN2863_c0_g2_i1:34-678(+)
MSHQEYSPYVDNGGTVLGLIGKDYCLIAADTRLSDYYEIKSRNVTKCAKLTDHIVLGTAGQHTDRVDLQKILSFHIENYVEDTEQEITVAALAQRLSNELYGSRFFPYYTFNVLGGFNIKTNKPELHVYDAVGSGESVPYQCSGSGGPLLMSILDSQLKGLPEEKLPSVEQAAQLAIDSFHSIAERDIYTGDKIEIYVINKDGIEMHTVNIRSD